MTHHGRHAPDRRSPSAHPARVSEDDQALFDRMAEGDEGALAMLYDRWAERVHTVAFWILGDTDDAEDVVEETFWQVWCSAARFDRRRAAASTWLLTIARSRAIDRLRSRRRQAEMAAAASAEGRLDGAGVRGQELAGALAERIGRSDALARELAALPAEQRTMLEMAFLGGWTHSEIAARMAVPLGTVKARIRLAMQKLQQRLASLRQEGS